MKMPEHIGPGCYHKEMDWIDESPGGKVLHTGFTIVFVTCSRLFQSKGGRGAWGATPRWKGKKSVGTAFAFGKPCSTDFVEKNTQVHDFTRRSRRHHRKTWRDQRQERGSMVRARAAAEVKKVETKLLRSEIRIINRRCRLWLTILAVHTSCTVMKQIKLQGRAVKLMRLTQVWCRGYNCIIDGAMHIH
jgi:hypothetical protein